MLGNRAELDAAPSTGLDDEILVLSQVDTAISVEKQLN